MKEDFFWAPENELVKSEIDSLDEEAKRVKKKIEQAIAKSNIAAKVFIGGSLAKRTLVRKKINDADIFIRFDKKYKDDQLSSLLFKIIKSAKIKGNVKKIHGSRDYFRIIDKNLLFEIVPVLEIRTPKEARNVTDLSYFHVRYVKNKIKQGLNPREIVKAKVFCRAINVYGAENYIRGFSGYGLECMIINYGSFIKMLRAASKAKDKLILDPERLYKNKNQIIIELNESKLKSPIVLIDPTWKERNVLAALSNESFLKFKEAASEFLKNPSREFFCFKEKDCLNAYNCARSNCGEFCELIIKTDKQEGDIEGSKLKKFYKALMLDIKKEFCVFFSDFSYICGKKALIWVAASPKKDIVRAGPPLEMKKAVSEFKRIHKQVFIEKGKICAKLTASKNLRNFMAKYNNANRKKISEMHITGVKVNHYKRFAIR